MNCKCLAHYVTGLPKRFYDICKNIVPFESKLTVIMEGSYDDKDCNIIEEYISFNCWEEVCSNINKMSGEELLEKIMDIKDDSIYLFGYKFSRLSVQMY